jgi:S-adenosylmethionine:tRNA ribosyltransferase-isomerase
MVAASARAQSARDAKVLIVDSEGAIGERPRPQFVDLLRPGDVVVANDAAVLPASLLGIHAPSGAPIEVRLAARRTLDEIRQFSGIVFGEGDFRTRTEDRPDPPPLHVGDRLEFGTLNAIVAQVLDHPRFVLMNLKGSPRQIWEGLARRGRPIQYAHVAAPLALLDAWTAIAGPPVAFEPPSAGFALDWGVLASLTARGVRFGAITHAAGVSSTGDPELDARLPFDEPYRVPRSTARLIAEAQSRGARIIAIGTTVVRALEHSAAIFCGFVPAGERAATQKIDRSSRLRVVDAILTGVHEQGSSHYELLRAFAGEETLGLVGRELGTRGFRTHEFGDSLFLEKAIGGRVA